MKHNKIFNRHIVIVNTLYTPFTVGGAEKSVEAIAKGLQKSGWKVTIITSGIKTSHDILEGISVHRLRYFNIFFRGNMTGNESKLFRIIYRVIDEFSFLRSWRIYTLIRSLNPDVVFTNNLVEVPYHLLWFLGTSKMNHVHTLRDYSLMCLFSSTTRNGKECRGQCRMCAVGCILRKESSKKIRKVVGVSNFTLNKHIANGYFQNAEIKRAIPNIYGGDTLREEKCLDGMLSIGFIGLVSDNKGVQLLFKALSEVQFDYELIIAGRESFKGYLDQLSSTYSCVRFKYLGWVEPKDFYSVVDLVVMPAIWPEPYPRTLIESRSFGLPVVVSDSGGTKEGVCHNIDGFIFTSENHIELKEYLTQLATNTQLYEEMSNASKEREIEYYEDTIIRQYEEIFRL